MKWWDPELLARVQLLIKVKVTSWHACAAREGRHNYSSNPLQPLCYMGWVVSTTPQPLYPGETPSIHCRRGWWTLGQVWIGTKNFALTGVWSLVCPAHSQSLHQLQYPDCPHFMIQEILSHHPHISDATKAPTMQYPLSFFYAFSVFRLGFSFKTIMNIFFYNCLVFIIINPE